MLIGLGGEKLGTHTLTEALNKAKQANIDLVQVSHGGNPVVCKLMDYGKHVFARKKQFSIKS